MGFLYKVFFSLILISLILVSESGWSRDPRCKGTPIANNSESALLAWMRHNGNKNKTIEDIICCMPNKYKKDYMVAHSSLSAQASHYKSPRLIFGDINKDKIMFSISGGDPNLPQSNSIEIMINRNNRLELYDLEFKSGRRHISKKNPEKCMSCHGGNGDKMAGGPRPIFDIFPWPRITGSHFDDCPERMNFMRKATEVTHKAIVDNPRFACLESPKADALSVLESDDILKKFNEARVNREMRASGVFNELKPFLVGLATGCILNQGSSTGKVNFLDKPNEWFTSQEIASNNKFLNIEPELLRNKTNEAMRDYTIQKALMREREVKKEQEKFAKMANDLDIGKMPTYNSDFGFGSCTLNSPKMKEFIIGISKQIESYQKSTQVYIYDSIIKEIENGAAVVLDLNIVRNGLARWAFESRGIDTLYWDMNLIPNYTRGDAFIAGIIPEIGKFNQIGAPPNEQCKHLKSKSLAQSAGANNHDLHDETEISR